MNRNRALVATSLAAAALVLAACSSNSSSGSPSASATPSNDDGYQHGANWSYSGNTGPENWGNLSPEYATCSTGKAQAPIDIPSPTATANTVPTINYHGTSGSVINDGHKIQMNVQDANSSMTLDGKKYVLEQVHYHSPSENTLAGQSFPLEFHFVHAASDGTGAVLAVFITPGSANPAWQPFIDAAQKVQPGENDSLVVPISWGQLATGLSQSLQFDGSLTTPPCGEGVKWVVNPVPVTMSQAQIDALTSVYSGNARPIQPLNGREVTIDKKP